MQKNTYANQSVIITGASSGIGRALAVRLAAQGAWLSLGARRLERLQALAEECQQLGGRALAVQTDVSSQEQCRALVESTIGEYGRLDMLVNNAGMAVVSKLGDLPDLHLFERVVRVNFFGAAYCCFYALPHLKAQRGRIVNVSSLGGKFAIPSNSCYIASKHALNGFSDSLRIELAADGVSVTVICPAWVATEFHESYLDRDGKPHGSAGRAMYTSKTMSADRCGEMILQAAWKRQRELVMPPGRLAEWLKLLAPAWLDRLAVERFLKPAIRREQSR